MSEHFADWQILDMDDRRFREWAIEHIRELENRVSNLEAEIGLDETAERT